LRVEHSCIFALINGLKGEIDAPLRRWMFKSYLCIDGVHQPPPSGWEASCILPFPKTGCAEVAVTGKEPEGCDPCVERWKGLALEKLRRWFR
jgi:hypothetical protein